MALAAFSSQPGFPFQWAPARFWAQDGDKGNAFNNCVIVFSPDAVWLMAQSPALQAPAGRWLVALLHSFANGPTRLWVAPLHPAVEVCPHQHVLSCVLTSLTPASGPQKKSGCVFLSQKPRAVCATSQPHQDKHCCAVAPAPSLVQAAHARITGNKGYV